LSAAGAAHVAGDCAREPDPVDQPGVDRIADDDLLAGLHGGQQHIEDAVQAAGHADALRARVVAVARAGADVRRRGLAQREVALKGQ
jgi:hypothetical protein